jgi:hypothetical protein
MPNLRASNRTVKTDTFTRFCLAAITTLLAMLVCGLWAEGFIGRRAQAQVKPFDTAAMRKELLEAQKQTNKRLDRLMSLLREGKAKVQVIAPRATQEGASDEDAKTK